MPRRDPVAALLRLRRIELRQATLELGQRLGGLARAEAALGETSACVAREVAMAEAADLAAWLPRARADRARAEQARSRAGEGAERAREAMAGARGALRVAEEAAARVAAERRKAALRAEGRVLDDLPRPATPPPA
jgi:hypothetical protein